MGVRDLRLFLLFALPLAFAGLFFGGVYSYNRPPVCKILSDHVPHSYGDDHNPVSPQQVHISLVGEDKMRISWITEISTPATIEYGTSPTKYEFSANGSTSLYLYSILYKSGEIHDLVLETDPSLELIL